MAPTATGNIFFCINVKACLACHVVFYFLYSFYVKQVLHHPQTRRFSWKWGDRCIVKSWRVTFPLSRPHWQPQEILHPVQQDCGPVAVLDTID